MPDLKSSCVPEYNALKSEWDQYRRLLEGGRQIVCKLPRISTAETEDNYKNRLLYAVDLAVPSNELQRQLDILTLSDFKIETDNEIFNEFLLGGVDGQSKSFTQWMIDAVLHCALVYGRCFPVVDRSAFDASGVTMATASSLPDPYGYVLSPLQVQAWKFTSSSSKEIQKAISTCLDVSEEDALGFAQELGEVYTLWENERVSIEYAEGKRPPEERINTLGVNNMTYFELKDSFFHDCWDATLTSMQHFTIASKAGQNQIGMMIISSDSPIPQIDVGNFSALQIPEKASAVMLSSPVEGITKNLEIAQMLRDQIARQLKNNMASMSIESVQQSGASKKQDQIVQEAFSSYLAHQLVSFAPQVLDRFARYLGINSYVINPIIPEEFVSKSLEEDRLQAQYLSTEFRPQTATEYKAWAKELRDLSGIERKMDAQEIATDNTEIDAQAQSKFNAMNTELELIA